jgi:hypothetical protein
MALTAFLALYRGRTVSEAELVAICADERIIRKFVEELAAKPAGEDGRGNPRGRVAEFKRGERESEK